MSLFFFHIYFLLSSIICFGPSTFVFNAHLTSDTIENDVHWITKLDGYNRKTTSTCAKAEPTYVKAASTYGVNYSVTHSQTCN